MTDTALLLCGALGWLAIVGYLASRGLRARRRAQALRENRAVIERAKAAWRRRDVPVENESEWSGRE